MRFFAVVVFLLLFLHGYAVQESCSSRAPQDVAVLVVMGQSNADGSAFADSGEDARLKEWYESPANAGNLKIWYRSTEVENRPADSAGESHRIVVDGHICDAPSGWMDLWYRNENAAGRTAMNMIHSYGTYSVSDSVDCARRRRGMEGEFGKAFSENYPDTELYIIKLGASGSFISSWADSVNAPNWTYFMDNIFNPAIADLMSRGKNPKLAGVWWMQGCADANKSCEYYRGMLEHLIGRFRSETHYPAATFYIGKIIAPGESELVPEGSRGYGAGVRKAQEIIADSVPGVVLIDTSGCPMQFERNFNGYIHFNHQGVNNIGRKLAKEIMMRGPEAWAPRRK